MPNTEDQNKAHLLKHLSGQFDFMPECWMSSDGARVRIDFLARPKVAHEGCPFFGIEVRSDYSSVSDVFDGLRQAVDYRRSIITDDRARGARGKCPKFVFLYPSCLAWGGKVIADRALLFPEEDAAHLSEPMAKGAEWLAWRWNCGVIRERITQEGHEIALCGANDVLWSSRTGWAGDAFAMGTNRGGGAR